MTFDVDNPYFEAVAGGVTVGSCRETWSDQAVDTLAEREQFAREYAWAIPNADAIETIIEYDPILEVGAGRGYWAHLVSEAGGEILATDDSPPVEDDLWHPVWGASAQAVVTDYPERTLMLVWPTHESSWPTAALGAYRSAGGHTVIYVGEGRGGCTADERFHQMLHDEWCLAETVAIPTYLGIHDRLEVWTR